MRIFIEGSEEWIAPLGQVFIILAAFIFVIGICFGARQAYVMQTWPRVNGTVVDASLIRTVDDNTESCSASYKIKYEVQGAAWEITERDSSSSSNCEAWQTQVEKARGAQYELSYDSAKPGRAYLRSKLMMAPFLFAMASFVVAAIGFGTTRLGRFFLQRKIVLP